MQDATPEGLRPLDPADLAAQAGPAGPGAASFWLDGNPGLCLPALQEDLEVDVAIVGGGMAGMHCALSLGDSGLSVAILEARQIGGQATGRCAAMITSLHGLRYAQLIRDFGMANARLFADANQQALQTICDLCARFDTDPGLARRDAVLYARSAAEATRLEEEARAANSLGLPASLEFAAHLPFPFHVEQLMRFTNQAQFDPVAYLRGLVSLMTPRVRVFQESRVTGIRNGDRVRLAVNGHRVSARHAVIATHLPIVGDGMFFAKAFPFAHPLAAAPLPDGVEIGGMFRNMGNPGRAFRAAWRDGRGYLIAEGKEFPLGDPCAQAEAVGDLLGFLDRFGIGQPTHLWINEAFRAMDGTAYIGPATPSHPNLLVATGFGAWGLTQGVIAGEVLAAQILGAPHSAAAFFNASRVKPIAGGPTHMRQNARAGRDKPGEGDAGGDGDDLCAIGPGQGGVVHHGGEPLAVFREADGRLRAFSAACPHLGCIVGWNAVDRTWDCPCHGSRFDAEGQVLGGPATSALAPRDLAAGTGALQGELPGAAHPQPEPEGS